MLKVTTSWDDGDVLDKRLGDLLSTYGLKGTFYITKEYRKERLSEDDLRTLSKIHEIGAHTLSHPDLRTLSEEIQTHEIAGSKKWLEDVLKKEVKMFCYPKGLYNETSLKVVKNSGFIGARTTQLGILKDPSNPYESHTTLQIYPFPFRKVDHKKYYWSKILEPYKQRAKALKALGVSILKMYSWQSLARETFNVALKKGGVFHLWGHSWEIEKYDMWNELEQFLQYVQKSTHITHVTNGDLLKK